MDRCHTLCEAGYFHKMNDGNEIISFLMEFDKEYFFLKKQKNEK